MRLIRESGQITQVMQFEWLARIVAAESQCNLHWRCSMLTTMIRTY